MMRLLLISTSTTFGTEYLDHCAAAIQDHVKQGARVLFVPFAGHDLDAYEEKARDRFAKMELELRSIHHEAQKREAIEKAEAIFIGGGNTFRLLTRLYEHDLLDLIRDRVRGGMPYIGTSAGSNVACVTIQTTNDMPIVQPPSFRALDLVPFNINPHYLDTDPDSRHMGETREARIREFHEMNDRVVVGLREGGWLKVEGERAILEGSLPARIFRRGTGPQEVQSGSDVSFLLRWE